MASKAHIYTKTFDLQRMSLWNSRSKHAELSISKEIKTVDQVVGVFLEFCQCRSSDVTVFCKPTIPHSACCWLGLS